MDSEENDDISIDFGKIKNFFKSDKEKKAEEKPNNGEVNTEIKEKEREDVKENEEDISIDFSKIKNLFKKEKTDAKPIPHMGKKDDEDISIDWGKVINFMKTYGVVFLALIPIILAIYIRLQAGLLLFTDDWATNSVLSNIQSQVRNNVYQNCPNCPESTISALVDTQMQKVISQNKNQIDAQIKATSNYFRSFFQDENGNAYTPDIDPYYWIRYAQNIVDHGHAGDILKDGKPFDNRQLAPIGRFVAPNLFHSYALAYFYKFLRLFANINIMRSSFYLIPLVSALCVLLVFLICRKIAGNLGGFFAALMMAINGAFLSRSLHPDDDVWVVFFPLVITWLFVTTMDSKKLQKIFAASALAGLLTGMYSFEWNGWWFIFDFLIVTMGVTLLYIIVVNFDSIRKNIKTVFSNIVIRDILIFIGIYLISSAIFVTLFSSWSVFQNSVLGPLGFSSIKDPVQVLSIWPNVLTTVAELNEGSINGIINSVGGPFLFFISLAGIILSISRKEGLKKFDLIYIISTIVFYGLYFVIKKQSESHGWGFHNSLMALLIWVMLPIVLRVLASLYKKDSSYDFNLSILLSLWFISTIFASVKGVRFTLLLAPAFSVAFGVAFGKGYTYLSNLLTKEFKIHKIVAGSMIVILLLLVYVSPIKASFNEAKSDIPLVNDAWYNDLKTIQKGSKPNAIITSWWDFGHHFKSIADRPVTFDGTTQTFPPAHWVGKLFMTSDERQAIGILKMLDCGQNKAFDTLYQINNNTFLSLRIVNEIIMLDKYQAKDRLQKHGLSKEQTDKILSYTHCDPPEGFVIASSDMATSSRDMDGGKSGVWAHFGSWNFERADIWKNIRSMPAEKAVQYMVQNFNYTQDKAERTYDEVESITSDNQANTWVAPWPGFGGVMNCNKNNQDLYSCPNGIQINLSNYDVFAKGQDNSIVRPKAVAFTTPDGMILKQFNGTTIDFGMTVIPRSENNLEVVLSSKELAGSMFVRMYKIKGHGLRYFKLFDEQHGLTGTNIFTYKADWEGKNITIVGDFVNKPKANETVSLASENTIDNSGTNNSLFK